MANTQTNVSVGKPKIGGAIYRAPLGTTLPTDATGTLNAAFKCLGYVSEDGLKNTPNISSNNIKAWGGDTVLTVQTSKEDTFGFKLIEVLNTEVLSAVYNSANVAGTALSTGYTVRVNSTEAEAAAWVFDMTMTGGVAKRIVVPNGKISGIGEIVYKDTDAIGYDITLSALPGGFTSPDEDTHKEYIKKSSTSS